MTENLDRAIEKKTEAVQLQAVPVSPGNIEPAVREFDVALGQVLRTAGLPTRDVLVPIAERVRLFANLGPVVEQVPPGARREAMYLAKFVAAGSIGLFDAALNYVWNETVQELRRKVANFDIEYFAQSLQTATRAGLELRNEEDLRQLEDWQLITGCKNCGIISDVAFKHLDYVRDMRNHASAAHPNQVEITGLQLAAWLEQCIKEVLGKPPEDSAINNKTLLANLRTKKLAPADAPPIKTQIASLPVPYANALLLAAFGLYVDPATSGDARVNIELVARAIWDRSSDGARNEIGCVRYTKYSANGDQDRRGFTKKFIELVHGQAYLSDEAKALELQELVENLWSAHMGMNNFHTEPAHARALLNLVTSYRGSLPKQMSAEHVRVVVRCKMTNGHGLCYRADPLYDSLINAFGTREVVEFGRLIATDEFQNLFARSTCAAAYKEICGLLIRRAQDTAVSVALGAILRASEADLRNGKAWTALEPLLNQIRL